MYLANYSTPIVTKQTPTTSWTFVLRNNVHRNGLARTFAPFFFFRFQVFNAIIFFSTGILFETTFVTTRAIF